MVSKVAEVQDIVRTGVVNPRRVFPSIKALAKSDDWVKREVAATALVEISKKQPERVASEMLTWSKDRDPNVRRTASEALRYIARKRPADVLPALENLKGDTSLYVRKSVANVLRNAGNYHPDFVLRVCSQWATLHDPKTDWTIKDGLRKLKTSRTKEAEHILRALESDTIRECSKGERRATG